MLHFLEQFLTPACLSLLLMLIAVLWHKRARLSIASLWTAIAVLFLGGNDWLIRWAATPLEWRIQAPDPIPQADAIVVLGGALEPKEWPRRTVEVKDSGDRILYAFELYRQKKAPLILCAGGLAEPGIREFSEAEDMRAMLESFGVPPEAILVETNSLNTAQNASYSLPFIQARSIHRILLVTTAIHMPRALSIFHKQLPELDITPAPTDYMFTRIVKVQLKGIAEGLIPTGEHLMKMDQTLHEYLGLLYYRVRWAVGRHPSSVIGHRAASSR
jgi:uncharacterized SAM-binding protein YcdF (DUF218 family)